MKPLEPDNVMLGLTSKSLKIVRSTPNWAAQSLAYDMHISSYPVTQKPWNKCGSSL